VKIPHKQFVEDPDLLLCRVAKLQPRIMFLQKLDRLQLDPGKPNFTPMKNIYTGLDAQFATSVAKSSVIEFNEFLKTL